MGREIRYVKAPISRRLRSQSLRQERCHGGLRLPRSVWHRPFQFLQDCHHSKQETDNTALQNGCAASNASTGRVIRMGEVGLKTGGLRLIQWLPNVLMR